MKSILIVAIDSCRLLHKYTLFSCCTIIMWIYLAAIMLPIRMPGTEHVVGYISSKPLLRITLCSVNKRYRSLLQYWSKTSAYNNDNILLTTSAALDLDIRRLEGSFVSTSHYCSTLFFKNSQIFLKNKLLLKRDYAFAQKLNKHWESYLIWKKLIKKKTPLYT